MSDLTEHKLRDKLFARHKEGILVKEAQFTEFELGLAAAMFLHNLANHADEKDRARLLELCITVVDSFGVPGLSAEDYTTICNDLLEKFRVNILTIIAQA